MLNRLCKGVFWLYVISATLALLLVPISERGLFGVDPSPLAGVFAVLLAQPWLSFVPDGFFGDGAIWNLALTGCCLAFNAALLRLICRLFRR
ncbi:MAG: hypothetical protein AB7F41_06325 [Methylocystis sp.]|uniref:hypothetical protein n=1 Tax=Methylocystis sp. TaxID=1911079 RepID=UPI003D10CA58